MAIDSIQLDPDGPEGLKLTLNGDRQLSNMEEFHRVAISVHDSAKNLTIDCRSVEFLDSSSLQVLCLLKKSQQAKGKRMTWVGVGTELGSWLSLSGLSSLTSDSGA